MPKKRLGRAWSGRWKVVFVPSASNRVITRWLPSTVLLVAVVVFALFVSSSRAVTWTGPGFSMFSAADYRATRLVQLTVETPNGSFSAELPASSAVGRVIAVPSESNADALGAEVLDLSWILVDGILVPDDDGTIRGSSVRVEVWTATVRSDHLWPELIISRDVLA